MSKKGFVLMVTVFLVVLSICVVSFAAEKKATASTAPKAVSRMPAPAKANFSMLAGTIASIDTADPANVKIMVKNDADGTVRTVSVTPWTNITKVTDISELKAGDPVRMMIRKTEDKDVAMGIMFGKFKAMPVPKAVPAAKVPASQTSAPRVKK